MYLAGYKWVDAERLKDCKKANGYRAAATDVFTLVAVLKERWPNVEGKTLMTLEGLSNAGSRALELLSALGEREQAPLDMNAAARLKQKAFSLFGAAYEDARRAVEDEGPSVWMHLEYRDDGSIAETHQVDTDEPGGNWTRVWPSSCAGIFAKALREPSTACAFATLSIGAIPSD